MHRTLPIIHGATHQAYAALLRLSRRPAADDPARDERDRGAVSLEQVLWFVAAGVSVAVVAGLIWNEIRDQANTDVIEPTPPAGP